MLFRYIFLANCLFCGERKEKYIESGELSCFFFLFFIGVFVFIFCVLGWNYCMSSWIKEVLSKVFFSCFYFFRFVKGFVM